MAIPKLIHYCWLSNDKWDDIHQKCFDSWKRLLPDYEFILWDSFSEAKDIPFVKRMVRQKSWAFASDYIRLYALYTYGGIYLDLDVELLKSLDNFLLHKCFIGREDEKSLACHILGAEKQHVFIKENLDYYNNSFRLKFSQPPTMPRIVTKIAIKKGMLNEDSKIQSLIDETVIYPSIYFTPLHYRNRLEKGKEQYISVESICIHHWHHSWSWLDSKSIFKHVVKQPWLYMNTNDFKRFLVHLFRLLKINLKRFLK